MKKYSCRQYVVAGIAAFLVFAWAMGQRPGQRELREYKRGLSSLYERAAMSSVGRDRLRRRLLYDAKNNPVKAIREYAWRNYETASDVGRDDGYNEIDSYP